MKKIILILVILLNTFTGLKAQTAPAEVCTSPASYAYDQEVTWYFDLTGNTLATPGQDLYFWSWEPQALPGGPALMTHENGMLWSLTFIPTDLYGVTVTDIETAGNSAFWCNILDGPVSGTATSVTGTIPYALKEQLRLGNECSATSCTGNPSPSDNTFLVNFGSAPITNPDTNSNYWMNVEAKSTNYTLIDKEGTGRYDITATGNFVPNNNSAFTTPDPNILGDMAISEATMSYLYLANGGTGTVTISCLNPNRLYTLSIFGSRNTTSTRETRYTVTGAGSTSGILQTSGTGIATDPTLNCNDDEFYVVDAFPSAEGTIEIFTEIYSGGFGYINMLKIEEVANPSVIEVTDITINTSSLSTSGPSQLTIDYLPVNTTQTGVNWSVDDENIAIIDSEGNLKPKQSGTVTVTATSSFNNSITDQVQVTFANLITEFYLTGLATEAASDLAADGMAMRQIMDAEGTITNQFEMYTSMGDTGSFTFFTTTDGSGTEYGGDGAGNLLQGTGNAITSPGGGWKYVFVDLNELTYSVTPMYGWNVISHMLPKAPGQEAWWGGAENLSTYQGNGIWSGTVNFSVPTTADDSPRFYIELAGTGRAVKQIDETQNSLVFVDQANGTPYTDIYLFNGEYSVTVDMNNYTYDISKTCSSIDDFKISVMGSSVAKGYGASIASDDNSQYMGYAHQYDLLLQDRATAGNGENWVFSNISIGGDKTTNLLDRFDYHLLTDCGKYVVYGLSLANEGLFSTGQVAFDQFAANMQILIQQAQNNGKIPVVIGNYANGNYNSTHYQFIKDMNLLIHGWDVPSINVMGAIDDGTGKWVSGHSTDPGHPNDLGYTEMMHSIVPSLFDALNASKPQPQLINNTWMSLGSQVGRKLVLTPEEQVHSFTVSVNFKTNGDGTLLELEDDTQSGNIIIDNSSGAVIYNSPESGQVTGSTMVNDGLWHTLTLTHFYARGETLVYVDGNEEGTLPEQFLLSKTSLNSNTAPASVDYSNWFFYRSGMNTDEIAAIESGDLLKSSLELYAPLDGQGLTGSSELVNLAQSTNTILEEEFTLGLKDVIKDIHDFKIIPNPANEKAAFYINMSQSVNIEISVYSLIGQKMGSYINTNQSIGDYQVKLSQVVSSQLSKGLYLCNFKTPIGEKTIKFIVD